MDGFLRNSGKCLKVFLNALFVFNGGFLLLDVINSHCARAK